MGYSAAALASPYQMAVAPPTPTAIIENVSGHRQMSCWDAIIIFPSGDSLEQIVANFMSQEAKKQISINLDLKTSEPQASDYALTLGSTLDSSLVGEIMVGYLHWNNNMQGAWIITAVFRK